MKQIKAVAHEDVLFDAIERWIMDWKESIDEHSEGHALETGGDESGLDPRAPGVHDGRREERAA
jgi:hypothetical protein